MVGAAEVSFLLTNAITYTMLRVRCDDTRVCGDAAEARRLRTINLVSGGLLLGTWAFGVVDGFIGYRRQSERWQVAIGAGQGGSAVVMGWGF